MQGQLNCMSIYKYICVYSVCVYSVCMYSVCIVYSASVYKDNMYVQGQLCSRCPKHTNKLYISCPQPAKFPPQVHSQGYPQDYLKTIRSDQLRVIVPWPGALCAAPQDTAIRHGVRRCDHKECGAHPHWQL